MPRPKRDPSPESYAGRVALALRELRESRGWSIDELQSRLVEVAGFAPPASTVYAYERGRDAGGVDLPWSLVPVIARVYGHKTAHGWLPEE